MSQRIVPINIDPIFITTSDGKERQVSLSNAGKNRVMRSLNVKTRNEMLALEDGEGCFAPILFEALIDKEGITAEQFSEILPYNPIQQMKAVALLMGFEVPDPPPAAESNQAQSPTANQ